MSICDNFPMLAPRMDPPVMDTPLKVGILLLPDFTLVSFSCLVEFLRLAADESDFSRKIYCRWSLLSDNDRPIRASCGFSVVPDAGLSDLDEYNYLIVCGGILHSSEAVPDYIYRTVEEAVSRDIPIVGLCTGQFLLAEMGLLDGRQCAVHFSLQSVMAERFPNVIPISDKPVVEDGLFMTSAGGLATISLAIRLVSERCGRSRVEKVMHYLMANQLDREFEQYCEGPTFPGVHCQDRRVANAIAIMRQRMYERDDIASIAAQVGTTKRELTRLFKQHLRVPPAEYWRNIRLSTAHWMTINTDRSIAQIAYECGFTDSAHLIRWFRKCYGLTPAGLRKAGSRIGVH